MINPHSAHILAHNLLMESELIQVCEVLGCRGIDFIVLKGVPLAQELHGSASARFLTDNDILVRPSDAKETLEALVGAGYELPTPWQFEDAFRVSHEYPLSRKRGRGRLSLDLHWQMFPRSLFPARPGVIWANTTRRVLRTTALRTPNTALALVGQGVQLLLHHFSQLLARELSLAWLRADQEQQTRTLDLAAQLGAKLTLQHSLGVCQFRGLLDDAPCPAWLEPSARYFARHSFAHIPPRVKTLAYACPAWLCSPTRSLPYAARAAFPSPARIAALGDSRDQQGYLARLGKLFAK